MTEGKPDKAIYIFRGVHHRRTAPICAAGHTEMPHIPAEAGTTKDVGQGEP